MTSILDHSILENEAALWWLGQAGYIVRSAGLTVAIDPYLTDSAAGPDGDFTRLYPPPLAPEELAVDVLIITHDHGDHLDPETIQRLDRSRLPLLIAPRHTARHLRELGMPSERVFVVEAGDEWRHDALTVRGVFALPTGPDVLDTTGYLLAFANGRSIYHTSDTAFHPLVLAAAPCKPEVMLVPINGKWGNPNPAEAVEFATMVRPRFVIPNHYDLMALNVENPETFRWLCDHQNLPSKCVIPRRMDPFCWS
jgi:L-ascorbate 6-phosphate lactonase